MLNLPKISEISAQYANILAQSSGEVTVQLRDTGYYLSFYETFFESYDSEVFIEFKIDSQTYYVLLKSFFFESYLKTFFPDLNIMVIDQEVKLVLIDLAFNDMINALKTTLAVEEIEIIRMDINPEQAKVDELLKKQLNQFPFRICNETDEKREALLLTDKQSAHSFLENLQSHVGAVSDTSLVLSRVYASIIISLGFSKMTVFDLYRVMVGDVIIIHSFKWHEDGFFAHLWAKKQLLFLLNIKDQDIIVEKKMDLSMADEDEDFFELSDKDEDENFKKLQKMIAQNDGDDDPLEKAEKDDNISQESDEEVIDQPSETEIVAEVEPQLEPSQTVIMDELKHMEIKLNFVVDSQVMSFEELQKLSPGYHFNLNKSPTSPISILANGKDFASGELVQIEENIGVKITKINIKK